MKEDAPTPAEVPRKRRQVEAALDKWLAEWLARDNLTPSVRRLLEGERERRKQARRRDDVTVGVLVGREGATPEQAEYISGYVLTIGATAITYVDLPTAIRRRVDGIALASAADLKAVVRSADVVLAAPRASEAAGTGVVEAIRYAKHRRVPVRIVLPDGREGV